VNPTPTGIHGLCVFRLENPTNQADHHQEEDIMTALVLEQLTDLQLDALPCRQVDPDAFFAELPADVEWAKSLCRDCPVRESCLAGACERREPWGVWGGELFINGIVVPRKRPRGRPRKHPLVEPAAAGARERAA